MKLARRSAKLLLVPVVLAFGLASTATLAQSTAGAQGSAAIESPKDLAGLHAMEKRIEAVAAKVVPAVVGIRIGSSAGSGVIVSADGIVMTAGHVVGRPGQPVVFTFADGKTAKGTTLGVFAAADAGLMKITDPGKRPFVVLGHSDSIKSGMWCVAIGHPLGYQAGRPPVVRVGRILQKNDDLIQTDCPLVGGDSGGPLLDLDGKVIGINSRIAGPTDVNLHVPVDIFRKYWDRLLKGETISLVLPSRNGPDVKAVFRQVVGNANQCVVRVQCDGQDVALGTIVGPDGWILTKASELKGRVTCRLRDGREFEARIVGICPPSNIGLFLPLDLAMLKIDALHLPIIRWNTKRPAVGQWLASAGTGDDPLGIGIVSVPRRAIPPVGGVIGVLLREKPGPAEIDAVVPRSPAAAAGLKAGDVITHVNAKAAKTVLEVRDMLRRHRPGEVIRLTVKRGGQTLELPVRLAHLSSPMNSLGVGVSTRSDDFPAVIQHDTVLNPVDCGGPVVDLSGKVVGVNIAHAGRTETYCLPTDVLIVSMYQLMSGRLSPALVEAVEKAKAQKDAAELKAAEDRLAAERKVVEEKAAAAKRAAEKAAAAKTAAELAARLENWPPT